MISLYLSLRPSRGHRCAIVLHWNAPAPIRQCTKKDCAATRSKRYRASPPPPTPETEPLQALERLDRVAEGLVRASNRISLDDRANGIEEELHVVQRVVALDLLVQVRVEGYLLDVVRCAHVDEGLAGTVVRVKHLLKNVEDQVGWAVLLVKLLQVRVLDLLLRRQAAAAGGERHNLLSSHAAGLGRKIDALPRALGDVPGGIADERNAADHTAGAHVLGDRVSLHFHDLGVWAQLLCAALADGGLVLRDGRAVHDSTSADADMVVLGEDPGVKVGRHVIADIHLGQVLIVRHLLIRNLDAFLEGNRIVVLAGVDGLGRARVGTVGTNDDVELGLSRRPLGRPLLVLGVLNCVRAVGVGKLNLLHKAVDRGGAELNSAVAKVLVHDLTAEHADVLILLEGAAHVNLAARGRDHLHLSHAPIDDVRRQTKLLDHAQRDGAAARLAVVHLALEHGALDVRGLRKDLGGTRARWATADDGYADRAHRDSSAGDDRGRGSAEVEAESSSGEGQHHRGGDAVRGRGGRK
mmetsp:Transcript_16027/g.52205  ORF Transcript_16027/g.52205 Transcript_16027/m.52205 type:complete len:524 (+) Transcript_16027:104-1675(+)